MNLVNYGLKVFLLVLGCSFIFPLYWMASLSFKSKSEGYDNPFGLPKVWVFTNFSKALGKYHFFTYFKNSIIYTTGTILITLLIGSMLAYCLSRMEWKYSKTVLIYISLGLIIPIEVVIIPLFMMVKQLGIKDSYFGLLLPYIAFSLSSCTLMLYAFFRSLPKELEEAACIDGCNIYESYFRIIMPVVMPALATQCVLLFMRIWNEFPLAFIIAGRDRLRPITIGLLDFFVSIGVADWGLIGAAMLISSLPTIIVYMIGNEKIENALTAGAILK
ncbi:carbohydrate ABC transporter permease [Cohnella silvisoli]|uniref:Carbohydrate ABC transporter permease n=1 Tax=Cohnella silvisoli TaxID=2873699 RepID=A0ABV1KWU1_9BACL|nr:carbohydrate ABC transporter permease [Cohnella silvisoli]MCD9023506.1 carbohydrate ABC transporter permease [Cohnella silvisoli]